MDEMDDAPEATDESQDPEDVLLEGETLADWERRADAAERKRDAQLKATSRAINRPDAEWRNYYDPHLGVD